MQSAVFAIVVALVLLGSTPLAQVPGTSPTCGPVNGKTTKDRDNVVSFCARSVPKDLQVQGAFAMESLLWVKVSRPLANIMMADKLSTEQVVKNWMASWKAISGSKAVTVHVEWQDTEIAKGQTTLMRGDSVTVR